MNANVAQMGEEKHVTPLKLGIDGKITRKRFFKD
jgi:hypothetical protein